MFPESDLAKGFWFFVGMRAMDVRHEEFSTHGGSATLNEFEERRTYVLNTFDKGVDFFDDDSSSPWLYHTLQDALIAYLVQLTSIGRFPYTYEIWLRMHTLILADVHREPGWLTVIHHVPLSEPEQHKEHTMIVADEWPSL